MTKHLYYRNGVEISEADALTIVVCCAIKQRCGCGQQWRFPITVGRSTERQSPAFSDGSNDPTQGNRPGWRKQVGDERQAVMDAYRKYDLRLTNAYWLHDGEIVARL